MRYVLHCIRCTGDGPVLTLDELPQVSGCPRCGAPLRLYEVDGEPYCWLHRERMASVYPVFSGFLTTEYIWRSGDVSRFPCAKLYRGGTADDHFSMSPYCESCERAYQEWSQELLAKE